MFNVHRSRLLLAPAAAIALAGGVAACGSSTSDDAKSGSSMTHSSMDHTSTSHSAATSPSPGAGLDAAFVRQMIPHHQMAVEMAKIAKQNAKHAQVKTLAAAIIKAQNVEIAQLRAIAKDTGVPLEQSSGMMAGDAKAMGLKMDEMGMSMDMHGFAEADPFDRAFIDGMIPHHQGAIAMANAELKNGSSAELKQLARRIIAAQTREIAQMKQWRKAWYGSAEPATTSSDSSMDGMSGM